MLSQLYTAVVTPNTGVQNVVRQHRLVAEMTQQELADRVGVTRQTIVSIEKGNYTPSVALALTLAKAFAVPVETLFQLHNGESNG